MRSATPNFPPDDASVMVTHDSLIRRVNPLDDPEWDSKIARCPGVTFFHGQNWARVLHDTYAFRPAYFVHDVDGEVRGLLPLMEVNSWLTGRRGISLPFTDECAPLGATSQAIRRLVREANAFGADRAWRHWELRGGSAALSAPPAIAFHGHQIDLTQGPETLFDRCESATRRAVRKAEKSHLTVTFSKSMEAMRSFHALLCMTRRRHGLPPQPWQFFENIQREILRRQHGCIVLAHVGDRPVSGAVFFHFGKSAIFKFGASDEAFQPLRPNNLVMWKAIEWHARTGFSTLDLGRTSLGNEGLRHFKLGWGAQERRIEYARFDRRAGAFVTTPDQSSGWHSRVFRLVPPSLARLIGAAAYRHVA